VLYRQASDMPQYPGCPQRGSGPGIDFYDIVYSFIMFLASKGGSEGWKFQEHKNAPADAAEAVLLKQNTKPYRNCLRLVRYWIKASP
jgi:hypothetical protein